MKIFISIHQSGAFVSLTWNADPEALQKLVFEPFNADMWMHHHTLVNFLEGIGVLVQEGLIDVHLDELSGVGNTIDHGYSTTESD